MISKKVRWALLRVGFIALGGIALLIFDKIEIWYRGKVKRDASSNGPGQARPPAPRTHPLW